MRYTTCLTLIATTIMLSGCSNRNNPLTPPSSGKPYEVLVFCDNDVWNGTAGFALQRVLGENIPALPQQERMFKVSHADPTDQNQITRLTRNIIIVDIDSQKYSGIKLAAEHDVYSSPQVILHINAHSEADLLAAMPAYRNKIIDFLCREELKRYMSELSKEHNSKVEKTVQKMFGANIWVSPGLNSMKQGKNFLWISNNSARGMQNICIYSYPIETLAREEMIRRRDSVMAINIPGELPSMHMQTVANATICDRQGMRALWQMANDAMGGPYISHSHIDSTRNRIIVCEAFVYAPETKKGMLLRALEASLYTFKLTKN